MTDVFSTKKRSWIMSRVHGKDTGPELKVRSAAHRLGFRFRLHRRDLPGAPDLVFPRLKKIIFVNGCFFHGHTCARGARIPQANRPYWIRKIARNRERDRRNHRRLRAAGWRVLVIWECQLKDEKRFTRVISGFLNDDGRHRK
jgi:DNA mismatch endonuclease (patch repair protein)